MLTYATIMLNADMHNLKIAKRMTKEQFLRSLAGISNGGDLSDHFLEGIYERVSARFIITNDDDDGDGVVVVVLVEAAAAEEEEEEKRPHERALKVIDDLESSLG